jgi:D-alanyl-D-alanine carboxypeptidase
MKKSLTSSTFLAALLLASCATFPAPPPRAPSTPAPSVGAAGLKQIDPAALQALVDTTVRDLMIPGAVVFVRSPQGDFTAASGTTELGVATPPSAGTHFRIASNTKTMTAALIMLLAQDEKLSLVDKVSKYVPDVPNGDKITIAQLLEMRSGLYNYTNDPRLSASMNTDQAKVWTAEEVLAMAFSHPLNAEPDQEFEYNNTNYALLGLIIEKADGKPLAEAMQDRLFGPLGLKHTLLPARSVNTLPEPYSHGYLYGSSSVALVGDTPYSPEVIAAAKAGTLLPTDYTGVNHSFAEAAGGAVSTADDLAIWIKALVGGGLLNPETQQIWLGSLKPEDPNNPAGQKYGYGIAQTSWGPNSIYFHGGETPGYNSKISYDPTSDVTLIVWTNLAVSLDDQQTANTLWVNVLDQIYTVSPLAPAATSTASP